MKRAVLLLALLLAACKGPLDWDMTAAAWQRATELCAPFGGAQAADLSWQDTSPYYVKAKCANGVRAEGWFNKEKK